MADITSKPVPRQTIPYGDRRFVDANGRLTQDAYQFLQRISGGAAATVENVNTVISQSNAQGTVIAVSAGSIDALGTEIANIETQLARIGPGGPPAVPAAPGPDAWPPSMPPAIVSDTPAAPAPLPLAVSMPPGGPQRPAPDMMPPGAPRMPVLPPSGGGTGQSASPTDGQLLIGDTAAGGWDFGTITAGVNISITTGAGAVTIALGTIAADSVLANAGSAAAVPSALPLGAGLTIAAGTLDALWNAGTVSALGPNLSLTGGTLDATGTFVGQWSAGTVTTVGTNLTLASGTLSASGGSGASANRINLGGMATSTTYNTTGSTSNTAQGQLLVNTGTVTISSIEVPFFSLGTSTTYYAQIVALNSGNTVTSVIATSAGITPISTISDTLIFSFGSGVAVSPGLNAVVIAPALHEAFIPTNNYIFAPNFNAGSLSTYFGFGTPGTVAVGAIGTAFGTTTLNMAILYS